jgi:hypothetical protein
MRGIDLDKKEPPTTTFGSQSSVMKQIKLKLTVPFNATVKAAEESGHPDLKKSATKMKSIKLPPDHATHAAAYHQWKSDIDQMAIQLVAHLENTLCNEFLCSPCGGSVQDAVVTKRVCQNKGKHQEERHRFADVVL